MLNEMIKRLKISHVWNTKIQVDFFYFIPLYVISSSINLLFLKSAKNCRFAQQYHDQEEKKAV